MAKPNAATPSATIVLPMWECELWQSGEQVGARGDIVLPMWECELWQSAR